MSSEQLITLLHTGDQDAARIYEFYCNLLALALSTVINIVDPAVIVLGGGLSNIDDLASHVADYWHRYVFSDSVATRMLKASHGDSSGVRGAAWLWPVAT